MMTLGGLISNALLLSVTMLAVSRIPLVVAQDGYLPGFLRRHHPVFGTPSQSLLVGSVAYEPDPSRVQPSRAPPGRHHSDGGNARGFITAGADAGLRRIDREYWA